MLAYPKWLICLDIATRAFLGCPLWFNLHDMCTVQVGLVIEKAEKARPCGVLLVLSVLTVLQHRLHVQVLNRHHLVLFDKPCR